MFEVRSRSAIGGLLRSAICGGAIATAALVAAWDAYAFDPLGNARVSFRADVTVTADGQRLRGRLYHRPGMQRHEFPGQGVTRILRFDLNRIWTLDHRNRTYTEAVLDQLGPHAGIFDRRRLADETSDRRTVGAERLELHRMRGRLADRTYLDGDAWLTGDGIVFQLDLRMHFVGTVYAYRFQLSGLRRMPMPETLFDVPVGYRHVARAPIWTPPATGPMAGNGPGDVGRIERMLPAATSNRPAPPPSTTSGAPGTPAAKNPYSLEQIFRDGTTSRK